METGLLREGLRDQLRMQPRVFVPSAVLVLMLVVIGAGWSAAFGRGAEAVQQFLVTQLGWVYIGVVTFLLVFVVALVLRPDVRRIRLGPPDSVPEYTYLSWFAMLFSAGMGIGLLFYSVAEPVLHYLAPARAEARTLAAANEAMQITFFHWGLHPWAIYITVSLALAFFAYRHGLPLSLRSALYPLIGERIHDWPGHVIDVVAVVGTLLGVATSLGLGVMQVNSGLARIGVAEVSTANQIILVAIIMALATASVASGLNNGIRLLSRANLFLAAALMIFVLLAGPTRMALAGLLQTTGGYFDDLLALTLRTDAFRGTDWQAQWTMFYWGWWISWCPFVGMFIARVSRGRTIGEFILGVLLVPSAFTFVWLATFGMSALELEMATATLGPVVNDEVAGALYALLDTLPLATVTVPVATLVIVGYFITSADSGALVMNILATGGNPRPPLFQKLFWSLLTAAIAAVLLLAGGLQALQTATLTTALPLSGILVIAAWGLVVGLRAERAGAWRTPVRDHPPGQVTDAQSEA